MLKKDSLTVKFEEYIYLIAHNQQIINCLTTSKNTNFWLIRHSFIITFTISTTDNTPNMAQIAYTIYSDLMPIKTFWKFIVNW